MDEPITRDEAHALLQYAEATYREVTSTRRRLARVALIVTAVFALLFVVTASQWLGTRNRVDDVRDAPLAGALGVEIPDPRPALERAQLRIQALLWGSLSAVSAVAALLSFAAHVIARPGRLEIRPPQAEAQPPI